MEIKIINSGEVRNSNAKSLSDIKLNVWGVNSIDSLLEQVIDFSIPVEEHVLKSNFIEDVKWHDVLHDADPDYEVEGIGFKNIELSITRDNSDIYFLCVNGFRAIGLNFNDVKNVNSKNIINTPHINGNEPDDYYVIAGYIYECQHRTRDFLQYWASETLKSENPEKNWIEMYRETLNSAPEKINNEKLKNWATSEAEKWRGNVEFTNFRFFAEGNKERINNNGIKFAGRNASKVVIDACYNLRDYRNFGSHNIGELLSQDPASLKSAITDMMNIAGALKNKELSDKLSVIFHQMCTLLDKLPKPETK